jgi:hypothetical protein
MPELGRLRGGCGVRAMVGVPDASNFETLVKVPWGKLI